MPPVKIIFDLKNTKYNYTITVAMQKWHIIVIQGANNVAKYAYTSSVFGANYELNCIYPRFH